MYISRVYQPLPDLSFQQNMYRMVSEVDTTCGKILDKLEEQGVLNNTLIIFTTDNGNLHGEHGLAEKCKWLVTM